MAQVLVCEFCLLGNSCTAAYHVEILDSVSVCGALGIPQHSLSIVKINLSETQHVGIDTRVVDCRESVYLLRSNNIFLDIGTL